MRVLPTPGSPVTQTARSAPACASHHAARRPSNSAPRPTKRLVAAGRARGGGTAGRGGGGGGGGGGGQGGRAPPRLRRGHRIERRVVPQDPLVQRTELRAGLD